MNDKEKLKKIINIIDNFKFRDLISTANLDEYKKLLFNIECILKDDKNINNVPLEGQLSFDYDGKLVGDI